LKESAADGTFFEHMISLKRAMESQVEETLKSTMASYSGAMEAVAEAGAQACPPISKDFKENLLQLKQRLTSEATPGLIAETEQSLELELRNWGEQASRFYKEKTEEVKEVLRLVARAAGDVAERDARYTTQFVVLSDRLQATVELDDLTAIRQSLVKNVGELRVCVTKMTEDGQESVAQLRSQIGIYEARLEEAERIAFQDALTGLASRRSVERQLDVRVSQGRSFSVIYLDLNGFKQINDTLGHAAGDDLLKQFAGELRSAFRSNDVVGRMGGDEFVVIVDGDPGVAQQLIARIEQWVNGAYKLTVNGESHRVTVAAAIGISSWRKGESAADVLRQADAAMYENKSRARLTGSSR
jgi:diguanylate cyclase (GGDEF)-like protein